MRSRGVNGEVVLGDAEALPFSDSSFDRVLCSFAIFLFPDLHRAFSAFFRVLTPAGRLGLAYSERPDEEWQWYDELIEVYGAGADLGTG